MSLAAEKELQHLGKCRGCENHDYDLVQELSRRLEFLWHVDQYIANAEGNYILQEFWRDMKQSDFDNCQRLKELIGAEIRNGCF